MSVNRYDTGGQLTGSMSEKGAAGCAPDGFSCRPGQGCRHPLKRENSQMLKQNLQSHQNQDQAAREFCL